MPHSRDARDIKNGSAYGREVEASQWVSAEWESMRMAHVNGIAVPYPLQICGTEIMMEFIEDPENPGAAAPRLQVIHPSPSRLQGHWEQLVAAMTSFARRGYAHGDLAPYNVLAAGTCVRGSFPGVWRWDTANSSANCGDHPFLRRKEGGNPQSSSLRQQR